MIEAPMRSVVRRRLMAAIVTASVLIAVSSANAQAPVPAPSRTLSRANELYDANKYYGASVELAKVMDGETSDSEANRQRATFFMAKTLFKLELYAVSLAYFNRIVSAGADHRYYVVSPSGAAVVGFDSAEVAARVAVKYGESAHIVDTRAAPYHPMAEDGRTVYNDRPATCRYYPLGFDWMKNLPFNEPTITMREEVPQRAIAATRGEMGGV